MNFLVRLGGLRRLAIDRLEVQRVLFEEALKQRLRTGAKLDNPQLG